MFLRFKKYFSEHKFEIAILIAIILIASFFRLYRISDYMTFLGDEGRDAIVAKDILRGDLTLLGPRASAGDFFLGPVYYYMMAPFLLLSNYDPVGPAVMVALFGIATVYLVFFVGKKMFGTLAGLIAASLYAIAPVVVAYSRSSWNPNPMPFFSLLMLYLLYWGIKKGRLSIFALVGFLLGIAMQLHYLSTFLAVIIFLLVLVGEYLHNRKNIIKRLSFRYFLIFVGFLAGFFPFLLFEIRHGFPNLKTIFSFILGGSGAENSAPNYSFIGNIWDVFYRLFGRLITKYPPPEQVNVTENFHLQLWMAATILLAFFAIALLMRSKDKLKVAFFAIWLIFGIGLFGLYKKNIYDYYLGFMFPLPFLLVGNLFSKMLRGKFLAKIGIVIAAASMFLLFYLNISGSPFWFPANRQKDQAKSIANFVLSKTEGKPFNFALLTRGNSDHVYRYFFEIEDKAPVTILNPDIDPQRKSVTDQLLIVCEYQECQPLGNPLWEVAGFGRASIAGEWNISFVKVYRLIHYSRPDNYSLADLKLDTTYENSQLKFLFNYPESFVLEDITNTGRTDQLALKLLLMSPPSKQGGSSTSKPFKDFMRINITVIENKENMQLEDLISKYDGRSGYEGYIRTTVPKNNSYLFEGMAGEESAKNYYFLNQNYFYMLGLRGGEKGYADYSPAAEKLFDEIVESIRFK